MLRKTLPAALALSFAAACAPPASSYDAGCYPAPTSYPSDAGSIVTGCSWTAGDCKADDLTTKFHTQFATDGTCQSDSDCALYGEPEGGYLYQYQCYETTFTPPINASTRGALDTCLQAMIASFCSQCYPDGGLVQGDITAPQDAGACVEVPCVSGQCSELSL